MDPARMMSGTELPSPPAPPELKGSPDLTLALDETWEPPWLDEENIAEWYWFAREYARVYRYHVQAAEYRLQSMYVQYQSLLKMLWERLAQASPNTFEEAILQTREAYVLYWDFDALLGSVSSALDVMARIVGIGYKQHLPPSFSRILRFDLDGFVPILRRAHQLWVREMKDYRDCLVHYTPVSTLLGISGSRRRTGGWKVDLLLPDNPNVRDIQRFTYGRHRNAYVYGASVFRHFRALDRSVAKEVRQRFRRGEFPARTTDLFSLGQRQRPS